MDDGEVSNSNACNTRYVIFSACGYGNIGDDAIMLGTARYLITRQDATDLFIFSYSPQGNTAVIRKSRIDLSSYNTLWAFYEFAKGLVINK